MSIREEEEEEIIEETSSNNNPAEEVNINTLMALILSLSKLLYHHRDHIVFEHYYNAAITLNVYFKS